MKRNLTKLVILLFFMFLFIFLAILSGSDNPSEAMYHIFAIIGMLHWIDKELLEKEPND